MATDHIRYDLLAQAALRGVVRTVMADVAEKGLPGEHHFKITFATGAPGVQLSDRMRAQYPQAMTIILQHQFWDLVVHDDAFEVGLSFGGIPEKLTIPFDAVTAFLDPAVQFGFQFEMAEPEAAAEPTESAKTAGKPTPGLPAGIPNKADETKKEPQSGADAGAPGQGGGEVVSLDRFRKK